MNLPAEYAERRRQLLERMGPGVLVLPSTPVAVRNNDVEHDHRQHSDLYYLTGFDEPETVLVLTNQHAEHRLVLFVRPRDPERETWDGPRAGIEGARERFGADAAFPIAELERRLPEYLKNVARLHYRLGENHGFDQTLLGVLTRVRAAARAGVFAPREIVDTATTLHDMRLRKSAAEVGLMERAAAITTDGHARALQVARPGVYEYEVEAALLGAFRAGGAERPAYGSIVGSGRNATILHYRSNSRRLEDGDLLLIDAGAEYGYYACDVTRTFPVNGRFSAAQRQVYDVVLAAQLAAIEAVRPGVTFLSVHTTALKVLVEGLIGLGIIEGPLATALEKETYKPYYMHRTSHWLGMDVHDVGDYYLEGKSRPLEPGMVLTIEPGLYIATEAATEPQFRGIGIRIEDDILVTEQGCRNLTSAIPKRPDELERLLGARS
jgi:Xaa-Pro aminopeptidase